MKVEDYSDMEKEKKNVDVCNFFVLTILCLHTKGEFKEFIISNDVIRICL